VLLAGAGVAVYLILVPLGMLLFAAFRGPYRLPAVRAGRALDAGELSGVYAGSALYTRILPDTFVFVPARSRSPSRSRSALAWLIERTDLPGAARFAYAIILFPLLVPIPVLAIAWIFLMGPNAGLAQPAAARARRLRRARRPINVFSMRRPDPLPVARLGALRIHPADRRRCAA
jgi:iron(III) transport system permease protein